MLLLAGCSGGGGNPGAPTVRANAGNSQIVHKWAQVTLDGRTSSTSTHNALTYAWTQTSGIPVTLTSGASAQPSFTAPGTSGTLVFSLVVRDGETASNPAAVSVQVLNRKPVAVAGANLTIAAGSTTTLDGVGSSDPDGDLLTQTWTQTSGTAVTLTRSASGAATFTAPPTAANLAFSVVVNDGEMDSAPATRIVTVQYLSPDAPTATSLATVMSNKRSTVTLLGSGTDPNNLPLSYHWRQVSGTSVALSDPTQANVSFVAPSTEGDLGFELTTYNGTEFSLPCAVTVQVRNGSPSAPTVTLSPAAPMRFDPITATALATDPDQDPITYAYVWKRNGTVVPGASGATLPLGHQLKGDVITCEASASDGSLSANGTASVTIVDSPAVLTATAPTTVVYGQPCAFQVSATDPNRNPVGDIVLDYGPAGFSVTPGGAVTWTPMGPLMDRQVDMNWGVRLKADPTVKVSGTITVKDSDRLYPMLRSNLDVPFSNAGMEVADFDGTGKQQILVGSINGLALSAWNGTAAVPTWTYPFAVDPSETVVSCVASADVDHDGKREIFFACGKVIVKLDGANRREVARFGDDLTAMAGPASSLTWTALKAADIDWDGQVELVCLGTGSDGDWIYALDARNLAIKWKVNQPSLGSSLAIGNVDNNPALEVITSGGYVFDGMNGANEWTYGSTFGSKVDAGDVDGDGVDEIVGAVDWTAVRIYKATLKAPMKDIPTSDIDAVKVANLDGTGPAEILVGDGQWGNMTIYRYNAGTQAYDMVTQMNSQSDGVRAIGVGDLDGDGKNEIVWGTGDIYLDGNPGLLVLAHWTPALSLLWKGNNPQLDGPFYGSKLAKVDAGQERLVFLTPQTRGDSNGLRLLTLDPLTGAIGQSPELGTNWSRVAAMDVADVNGDGWDEVLLGSANYYDDYFSAFSFRTGATLWTSPKLADAKAITHADLNGDGKEDLVGITIDGHVYAYDVAGQTALFTSPALGGGVDVAVADFDGDGRPEIVALTSSQVVVFGWSSSAGGYLQKYATQTGGESLLVADADGDGKPEIYVLGGSTTSTVYRFDGTLQALGSFPLPNGYGLHLENLGTGKRNLLTCLNALPIQDPSIIPSICRIAAVDPVNGSLVWQSPMFVGAIPPHSLSFFTLSGETQPRMSFGLTHGMVVTR